MLLSLCQVPTFGKMAAAFDNLQAQVTAATDLIEKLKSEVNVGATRVEGLETASNLVHVEAQASFMALGATVAELQALYHSGGPAPAPAPASTSAVDPMARGNDSWSTYLGKGGPPSAPAFASASSGGRPKLVHIGTSPTLDPSRSIGR